MIFDSDILIWAFRGHARAADTLDEATDRALSIITLMEIFQGVRSKSELREIQQYLRQLHFRILPLSESIGARAVALIEAHTLAHGLQFADALIAATAIDAGERLCTANLKHFRPIKNLSCAAFRP